MSLPAMLLHAQRRLAMVVATHKPKRSGPMALRRERLHPAPLAGVPTIAIVPTAWGVCGIVWKCPLVDH